MLVGHISRRPNSTTVPIMTPSAKLTAQTAVNIMAYFRYSLFPDLYHLTSHAKMARGRPNVYETKTACRYIPKDETARALLALAVCEYKTS